MNDDKKLTLGSRPPLGIKKTIEAGKVKQSFSHGRSKTVMVEVKKRRVLGKAESAEVETPAPEPVAPPPPAAPMAPVVEAPKPVAPPAPPPVVESAPPPPPPEPVQPAAAPAPAAAAPAPAAKPAPAPAPAPARRPIAPITGEDRLTRQERVQAAIRQAEEERMRALEEQRRRTDLEREAALAAEREAREAKRRAGEEEAAAAEAEAAATQAAPASDAETEARAPGAEARPVKLKADAEEDDAERARPGQPAKRKPEVHKPARVKGDERRQSGKLTVVRALEDEDSVRVRSMAALKRAREKERRSHMMPGQAAKQVREVVVPETITVQELANRMAERASDVIKALFKMGVVATLNQSIDQDTAELIVTDFGHMVKRVAESDVEIGLTGGEDVEGDLQPRPPVVTIMGHVDHGKTSLLDALRGTDVVAGEAGGITQHIGAYQVTVKSGDKITFLDTPGHEAFTEMRARGANVTDIVILVVAADDGLMPQTIEAINHTKAAGVPMIVAINKMDKPGANPAKVREALLQHDVQVEAFGGEVQDVEVSALKKLGLDELIEKILLQAEILELKANPDRPGEGTVIEAKLDKGRGPLATVLVSRGTVKVGDIFVVGAEWGKVRALVDDKGRQIKSAGPSQPVEVLGLSGVPGAGDAFSVVESEARAREVAAYRQTLAQRKRQTVAPTSLESMFSALKASKAKEFPVVIKADVHGSVEAISQAVNKLSTEEIKARVLHAAVGGITESDVTLAKASNAPIVGFNVRANAKAREVAERDGVVLKYYNIIYDLVDDMKAAMAGQLGPEMVENVVGRAEVREVFQAGKAGKAAGLIVREGNLKRNLKARILRDDVIVYDGSLSSLRRFKDDVNDVRAGLECGVTLENFQDIKVGDMIEAYEIEQRERTL
ncbi:translation initiation factor IF-2 [Parapedomonas caeni]